MTKSFEDWKRRLLAEIRSWPADTALGVFPEYCWRLSTEAEVLGCIEELESLYPNLVLVLGSYEFVHDEFYTTNAIVLHNRQRHYFPKVKVLADEVKKGLSPGINPGVIQLPKFRLGVVTCADLYEPSLIYQLAVKEKADIIVVPAWTNTAPGNRALARLDWYSLARTISTQYCVVVAVADHAHNYPKSDVGNATIIFSPADRHKRFLTKDIVMSDSAVINLDKLSDARKRWQDKGLYPLIYH